MLFAAHSQQTRIGAIMATRTAPTVDGSVTFILVSVSVIDYTGDDRTDTYQFDSDSSDAEVESFISTMQLITNASIWKVEKREVYEGAKDKSNADELVRESVYDNLVLLYKDSLRNSRNIFVPAVSESVFVDGSNEIDPTSVPLANFLTSITPMLAAYDARSARFSERRKKNKAVNL